MRCPKCHYISFDSHERCRNCGYEFSLSADTATVDLPIQTGDEAIGPLADFALSDPVPEEAALEPSAVAAFEPTPAPQRPVTSSFDLPLFKDRRIDEDAPLVTPPAVPRVPLSVRRSTPAAGRSDGRMSIDEPGLDLGAPETIASRLKPLPHALSHPAVEPGEESIASAGVVPRLLAAVVDASILGAIAAIVVYFTLKLCGLQLSELSIVPPVPLGAFLLLVGGGYFVLFTAAGGQTIGKMAAGIKVVPAQTDGPWRDRVPLGHAVLRAAGYLVSVLPAGLGLLPALFGADRRAVHDRLADTRVVKA
jgi:uncharacterized RDD family membrane protein YckC